MIMQHVISYYNNDNTNVYGCMLDASKAFERVHYGNNCTVRSTVARYVCAYTVEWMNVYRV